ncbi:MAG: hypothetical protein AAF212_00325 [Verrucomicrobiota bacterium]
MSRFIFPLFVSFGFLAAAHASEDAPLDLRSAMGETFEKAGLDGLTLEQLSVLENWIQSREDVSNQEAVKEAVAQREAEVEAAAKKGFGFLDFWKNDETIPDSLKGPESISAAVSGKFRGWDRDSRFSLDNGQVWAVSNKPDRYYIVLDSPEVEIKKATFGGHVLEILETGKKVRVKRIK